MGTFHNHVHSNRNAFTVNGAGTRTFQVILNNSSVCRFFKAGDKATTSENNKVVVTSDGDNTIILECGNCAFISEMWFSDQGIKGRVNLSNFRGLTYVRLFSNSLLTSIANPLTANIYTYIVHSCNLTGTLDISTLTELGQFYVYSNPNLTEIINPISTTIFTNYQVYSCNLTGTLDISGLSGFGGVFLGYANPLLTEIINPTSSTPFSEYKVNNCDLTGTLDISGLSGFGGDFRAYDNPHLTSIINPTSSTPITVYLVRGCNLTGILDVSGLTGLGSEFQVYSNPNLTGIINPVSNRVFINYLAHSCNLDYINLTTLTNLTKANNVDIELYNNSMSATDVNHILVDLDTMSVAGYTGRVINISGTNAAPDTTSGGYNGTAAKLSLISKGFTVTTT